MELSQPNLSKGHRAPDHLLQLSCSELLLGMYVYELDCPWSRTPFPMGGFHLKNVEDIEILAKHCKQVVIDINKGVQPRKCRENQLTILSTARRAAPESAEIKVDRGAYPVTHTIKQQIDKAYKLHQALKEEFKQQSQALRGGAELNLPGLEKLIKGLIDSVLANPQTHVWLLNTDPSERNDTDYCVRAALWATILGRQVGMHVYDIQTLCLGTLLADIGMQLLPEKLVKKRGPFRMKELLAYRKHVEFGEELISHYPDIDPRIAGIIRSHHERQDGLGFPQQLCGKQIPVLARFANLSYCFERLLRNNGEGPAMPPSKALSKLYKQRVLKFPEQLVVELIHVLGTYPVGSLVQLSTGEIALVLEQTPKERLSPKIALLTDKERALLEKPKQIDLANPGKSKIDRAIVSSYRSQNSAKRLAGNDPIDSRNYIFSFCGRRMGLGPLSVRI